LTHGGPADAEVGGELALAADLLSGGQRPRRDLIDNPPANLLGDE
jgi:hypothetical protein